jgi:hypothetical protein
MTWAPGSDLLAYTLGVATEGQQEVRILDPIAQADEQLAMTSSQITGLAWSPIGASVAIALPLVRVVRILDLGAAEKPRVVRLPSGFAEPLVAWSADPAA